MNIYNIASNLSTEERSKLVFEEVEKLEKGIERKSKNIRRWSTFFAIINTSLNLIIIVSSAIIVVLASIYTGQNIPNLVLGAVIFVISGVNTLLKLGDRGFYYRQNNVRLRKIHEQVRNIIYMFHTYSIEQVLANLSSFRTEIDELDLNLYKSSMIGEAKYDEILKDHNSESHNDSHIHIHIDSSSSNTPNDSPYNSPKINEKPTRTSSLPLPFHQKKELRRLSDPFLYSNKGENLD